MGSLSGRVVLITNPGADLYGSDRMVLESVSALIDEGARVVVTVPQPGPLVAHLEQRGAEVRLCPTVIVRKSFKSPAGILRLLITTLRTLLPGIALMRQVRPDVVYVNTITSPMWGVIARLCRRPVVCHVHEAESATPRPVLLLLYAPLLCCRRIIANSEFSRSVLVRTLPALGRRTTVVHNAVVAPVAASLARERPDEPLRILYVGRLSPRKGPDVLVDAVALLARRGIDAKLGLVGSVFPGYEWYERQLRADVQSRGLGSRVQFHGFHADVWPFYRDSDIVAVPSRFDESFGNVAVESVLAARPVIASDLAGLREATAGLGAARLTPVGDSAAIADAVQQWTRDWSHVRLTAHADSARAAEQYSPRRYAGSVTAVVSELVGLPAPRSPAIGEVEIDQALRDRAASQR